MCALNGNILALPIDNANCELGSSFFLGEDKTAAATMQVNSLEEEFFENDLLENNLKS